LALQNTTSVVSAALTLAATDSASGATLMSHVLPIVSFKAAQVQQQVYVNMPSGTTLLFVPSLPVTAWAVVFVRNLGGVGQSSIILYTTVVGPGVTSPAIMDAGAMFLYVSPALSTVPPVAAIVPGIFSMSIQTGTNTNSNVEVFLAG